MLKNLETCLEREDIQGAKQCLFEMLQLFRKSKTENVFLEDFEMLFKSVDDVLLTLDNEMAVSRDFVIADIHVSECDKFYLDGFHNGFAQGLNAKKDL